MKFRKLVLALAITCLVPGIVAESYAQSRQAAKAPAQPKLTKSQSTAAVRQLQKVRNKLGRAEKLAKQKYKNVETTVRRTREVEQGLLDGGARESSSEFRRAKARRVNAENALSDFGAEYKEARRQTRSANRTLSFAKKGDWISAHSSASAKNNRSPKPVLKKITFNEKPLGPTPKGNRKRAGFLNFIWRN